MIQSGIVTFMPGNHAQGDGNDPRFNTRVPFQPAFEHEPRMLIGLCGLQSAAQGFLATVARETFTDSEFTLTVQTFAIRGIESMRVSWIVYGMHQGQESLRTGVQVCHAPDPNEQVPYVVPHGLGSVPSGVFVALSQIHFPGGRDNCHVSVQGLNKNGFTFHLDRPHQGNIPNDVTSVSAMWLAQHIA